MFGISVGFTGTAEGMTRRQKRLFASKIVEVQPFEFHHGDCIGADAEAHDIVRKLLPQCRIIIHPPSVNAKRAFCEGAYLILPPKDYLVRNKDIVSASSLMFATPKECDEQLRSGTWATVRYARTSGVEIRIIFPRKVP